jgi:CheY-like chemotaxis protein
VKKIILVVDDDADSRTVEKEALIREGFDVVEAADGSEALSAVERQAPDAVVLDLRMPVMNGWETARRIKKINAKIPVIAVTAHALAGDREKAIDAGCDDYLAKPCHPKDVVRKVAQWISHQREGGTL